MKTAVYKKPRELVVEERPVPVPGEGEVLVEVSHCGVCGTDLHMVLEGMGIPNSVGGHEYSGRVVAVGGEVSGWAVGDQVVGGSRPSCGACAPCQARRPSLCLARPRFEAGGQGAFAEYVKLHASQLVRVPEGLPLRVAALAEPMAVALHAVTVSRLAAGERALVTGAGPLGLLVIAALVAQQVEVVVSEPAPLRAERARQLGAARVVAPDALEAPPMPFEQVEAPFDAALDCSGNPRAMEGALGQLRTMGTLVIVGTGMRHPKLDHNRILMNELMVTGAYCYDTGGFEAALSLLGSGRIDTGLLVEERDVSLDGLLEAVEASGRGERAAKVVVAPRC